MQCGFRFRYAIERGKQKSHTQKYLNLFFFFSHSALQQSNKNYVYPVTNMCFLQDNMHLDGWNASRVSTTTRDCGQLKWKSYSIDQILKLAVDFTILPSKPGNSAGLFSGNRSGPCDFKCDSVNTHDRITCSLEEEALFSEDQCSLADFNANQAIVFPHIDCVSFEYFELMTRCSLSLIPFVYYERWKDSWNCVGRFSSIEPFVIVCLFLPPPTPEIL